MKRRVAAAIIALLLAGLGAFVLLAYVGNADRRAMAGLQPVDVLVVTAPVPEGTTAEALGKLVETKTMPQTAVAERAVSSLTALSGQVATTDLQPGEQVLASRFANPATLGPADEAKVPKGLQTVAVALDPPRALGGRLAAGDTVGVFLSLPKDGEAAASTRLVLDQVLVTRVEGGSTTPVQKGDDAPAAGAAAAVTVTLAVSARDAETLVFGAEHGTLWLSLEPADAVVGDTRGVTRKKVSP